uniref:Uncharacterized protein n=1 Tax=Aegilops tauschii TaxID=37682 RepID=R7W0T2_AEGTA
MVLVVVVSHALCHRQGRMCDVLSPTPWHQGGRVYRIPLLDYAFYRQPQNKSQVSYLFLFFAGCSKKQDSQVHLLDAFQYIYFPLCKCGGPERPGRSQPPPQAVQRHLRRRFIAKTATWIPLVPTSNARSSTSSLSCCSVAQLLHLVEGAMEVGNRGDSAMELEAEVSLFAAATSGSPVPGGVAHRPGGWASRTASRPTSATTTSSRLLLVASNFLHLMTSQEISTLAVSLSTNALKFYAPATGQYLGECTGHTGSIHEIAFSAPSSLQVICSCW